MNGLRSLQGQVFLIVKQTNISSIRQKKKDTIHLLFSILIALILFISLQFGLMNLKKPQGYVLDGIWYLSSNDETTEINLPFFQSVAEEGIYIYTRHFGSAEGDTLVIPQISAYGYEIILNGVRIAKINNPSNKTANVWNQTQMITFDPQLLKENSNTLEIKIFGLFDHGINYLPYLAWQKEVLWKVSLNRYLENDIYLISIGAAISFGFVLFALGLAIPEKKAFHYSFALTAILIGLYLFDYPFRFYTCERTTYLFFRKILFSSLYLSGFFLLQGTEYYLYGKRRFSKFFVWMMPILIGAFLLMPDFQWMRAFNKYALIFVFLMITLVAVQIYLKKEKAFIFAATILSLCMINDVIKVIFNLNHVHMISYGIIITVLSMGVIIVNFFRSTYGKMVIAHGKAMKDPLTNAFNRNVLETIETTPHDIMVLVDFDNFKIINDLYGHSEGDRVLKMFTDKALEMLRNEDMIVRIGGDEFMIFMKNCSQEIALKRVENIRKTMADEIEAYDFNFSYGSCSLKSGIKQAFSKADEVLYDMKNEKKPDDYNINDEAKGD